LPSPNLGNSNGDNHTGVEIRTNGQHDGDRQVGEEDSEDEEALGYDQAVIKLARKLEKQVRNRGSDWTSKMNSR
jgi:hypothetical protein